LYAFIQREAGDHRRGRILATVGLLDSLAGLAGGNLFVLTAADRFLDVSPSKQFLLLAGLTLADCFTRCAIRRSTRSAWCCAD